MKFIIVLIALALEKYVDVNSILRRFTWFNKYLDLWYPVLSRQALLTKANGILALALIVLPIPIVITILYAAFCGVMNGLISFLIAFAVLIYCLGPESLYRERNDQPAEAVVATGKKTSARIVTVTSHADSFIQANEKIFAVLLWFTLLGPFGALVYRYVYLVREAAIRPGNSYAALSKMSQQALDILDWLPARFFSLGYAVVGNFSKSFGFWLDNVLTGTAGNQILLVQCAHMAMETQKDAASHGIDKKKALEFIDRVLMVFLVILAIFTLGKWVY